VTRGVDGGIPGNFGLKPDFLGGSRPTGGNRIDAAPYAILAIIVGVTVVAVGGVGIVPMRRIWERSLARMEAEAPRSGAQARAADPDPTRKLIPRLKSLRPVADDGAPRLA
jgi:hypothetical protein